MQTSQFDLETAPSGQWSLAVRGCPWFQLGWEDGWQLLWQQCTKAAVIVRDLALPFCFFFVFLLCL